MAIRKCNDDLNIIASLPDTPAPPEYTATVLKAQFDRAALLLKAYINDKLIPDITDEILYTATGDGVYRYIPSKVLIASYTTPGTYTFDTEEHPSFNGIYDIVVIGGGGGGSMPAVNTLPGSTGGGSGAVTEAVGLTLDGEYTVSVGAAGTCGGQFGTAGESSTFHSDNYSVFKIALGGRGSSQSAKIGFGGGIGGSDSEYGDGTVSYGHGGDNRYGRGARGADIADSVAVATGYGAGGWGCFQPTPGAVLIYGYVRQEISNGGENENEQ